MLLSLVLGATDPIEQVFAQLATATRQLQQCTTIKALLQTGVQQTQALFGSDRAVSCQVSSETTGLVVAESLAGGGASLLHQSLPLPVLPSSDPSPDIAVEAIDRVAVSPLDAAAIANLSAHQIKAYLASPIWINAPPAQAGQDAPQLWGWLILHQCQCGL